jgi:hypothetical protein
VPIAPVLPNGMLELTTPVAYTAHALMLMIAHVEAFQEWCGVSRWEDACRFLDLMRGEVQDQQHLLAICDPFVLVELPKQTWSTIDNDRFVCRPLTFDIGFTAKAKFNVITCPDNVALSCLEFSERVGRVISGLGELSNTTRETGDYMWPNIDNMTESEIPLFAEFGRDDDSEPFGVWNCRWQITAGGVQ